jgi:putative transposase
MLLGIKTQLKLNKSQRVLMAKHAGISRFTYNWGLATWSSLYKDGFKPDSYTLKKFFNNSVKPALPWLSDSSICGKVTEFAFANLKDAFKRFFQGIGEYPQFKKKGKTTEKFTINAGGRPISIGGKRIKLPTIGWVKTYESLPITTTSKITISVIAGNWFISFAWEQSTRKSNFQHEIVGVDLGIKELATLSTGVVFSNPKARSRSQKKLAKQQRQLARKVRGSNHYFHQKLRVAKTHYRTANIRLDATHKATNYISKNHAKVVLEDLNVSGMMANQKLAGAVSDANFYEFRRQVEYKALKFGSSVVIASRFYPSSKPCSSCSHQQDMPLKERVFTCGNCGRSLDRDLNAAKNLAAFKNKVG